MEIIGYLNILWKRKWIMIITVIVTMLVVFVGTSLQTPIYQASATIRIAASTVGFLDWYEYQYISELLNTYTEVTNNEVVMNELSTRLGTIEPLNITAELIPDTELVLITVEDADPQLAATAANTLADILTSQSKTVYSGSGKSIREILGEYLVQLQADINQVRQEYAQLLISTPEAPDQLFIANELLEEKQRIYEEILITYERSLIQEETSLHMITVVDRADVPQRPVKPNPIMNYGLGLLVSIIVGLGLAFVLENVDPVLYQINDIQNHVKAPILGKLPETRRSQLNIFHASESLLSESFRRLATRIDQHDNQTPRKILLLTSVEPKQGTSMITNNLAFALAERGEKVIVIDCNLRSPKQHILFGLSNEQGLIEALQENLDYKTVIQESDADGVSVLTSGSRSENPSRLLVSPQMKKLLDGFRKQFDRILIDTPAILSTAEANILFQNVDGAMLVVRPAHTRQKALQESTELMRQFSDKFLGLISNEH